MVVESERPDTSIVRTPPRLPKTIWYMGAKTRVIPNFLDRALDEELAPGSVVVDLMSGTGVVSALCADRHRVFANDAEAYAHVIARAWIEHDPETRDAFVRSVDPRRDLGEAFARNVAALEALYAPALAAERDLLDRAAAGEDGDAWCRAYRAFLTEPGAVYGAPAAEGAGRAGLYGAVRRMLSEPSIASLRRDPSQRPAILVTAYHANVYYGLRQAIAIDSIRAAIADLGGRHRFTARKEVHYLSALLHAASLSTSGTSHFAQPRHLTKGSELLAMARRRRIDVLGLFEEFSREILETIARTSFRAGNQAFRGDYRSLIEERNGESRFRLPAAPGLVYLDPPYTADHYSRFYHVLNVIARYDYPELELDSRGRVVRGRYERIAGRFQSDFCRKTRVEDEFRRVIRAAAGSGAKLVISYASPTGLLIKRYAAEGSSRSPVERFEALCRESYRHVETRRLPLVHSGQGEDAREVEELLLLCRN